MGSTIFSLWIGRRLSLLERLCAKSFLANGHDLEVYAYGPIEGMPDGVSILPAADILPESLIGSYTLRDGEFMGMVSPFSDLFRLKALLERGGTWVDLDIVCLAPFDFPGTHTLSSERQKDGRTKVTNSVMRTPAGDAFVAKFLERAMRIDPQTIWHQELGSNLIPPLLEAFALEGSVESPNRFCPIDWWEWSRPLTERFELPSAARGLHLWNSFWVANGADKDQLYPETTLYGTLQRRYL